MRVTLLGEFRGGSGEALVTLADYLSADHEIRLFGYPTDSSLVPDGAHVTSLRFDRGAFYPHEANRVLRSFEVLGKLRSAVEDADPDAVFSQLETSLTGARVAGKLDVPHLVFLHDTSMLHDRSWSLRSPVSLLRAGGGTVKAALDGYVLRSADRVIANSRSTAEQHRAAWDVDPDVVYPFIDVDRYAVDRPGGKILHVNPSLYKGADVTYGVARRMEDEEFLVAGTPTPESEEAAAELEELPNVEMLGYVDDMREVYREARLVLMPSRTETFGRIPIEAGSSGIPTVASDTGGLPEAVGSDELVVEGFDAGHYVEAIRRVDRDYDRYRRIAKENAEAKAAAAQYEALTELLGSIATEGEPRPTVVGG